MPAVHRVIGFGIVGGFLLMFGWGGVLFVAKRDASRWFWALLAVLQVALLIQLLAGIALLVLGRSLPGWLHFAYGAAFPAIVLVVAHVIGRGLEDQRDAWKVFAVAAFFVFGLTLRALTTGLGMP
jgi:predicted permease